MKIRQGFVSNSSSSSFIIGIGKIKNKKKLNDYLEKNDLKKFFNWDIEILNGKELIEESKNSYSHFSILSDKIYVEAMVNSCPSVSIKFNKKNEYLIFNHGNDEGDSYFYDNFLDELNYNNVDYDYFSEKEQKMIDLFKNKEIIDGNYLFGADRNG